MSSSKKRNPKSKKKTSPKKKTSNQQSKNENGSNSTVKRSLLVIVILLLIVFSGSFTAYFFIKEKRPLTTSTEPSTKDTHKNRVYHSPVFEVYPEEDQKHIEKEKKVPLDDQSDLPMISIIIDDLGYDRRIARKFLKISPNITFSILPHSPYQKHIAKEAKNNGTEIMLHLPMEPLKYPEINSVHFYLP